jgi:hypothetical protein
MYSSANDRANSVAFQQAPQLDNDSDPYKQYDKLHKDYLEESKERDDLQKEL